MTTLAPIDPEGQPVGGSVDPSGAQPDTEIVQYGPEDPETGLPKYSVTVTNELQQKFGEPPVHIRKFRAVQEISYQQQSSRTDLAAAVNTSQGSPHPVFSGASCTELTSTESVEETATGKKLITEITAVYTVVKESPGIHPLSKPDIWSFQTQGAAVAAFFYFNGSDIEPLTNSAGDYIKGLQVDEAQTKVVIKGNRASFPSSLATALTNCVNGSAFLGGSADHWKCQGISGQLKYESVNGTTVKYWEVTVELLYRQTGWNLQLPDIGFNYISDGQKRRAMVFDNENKEWLASADPIALNGQGGQVAPGDPPAVLNRRLYRRVDFSTYFGTPPA